MLAAADRKGFGFKIASAFRSYGYQQTVYGNVVASWGQARADQLSARPGFSEHQTGLAVDLVTPASPGCDFEACFATTPAGRWLHATAWRFGFVVRYPAGSTEVTGYAPEPWHLRYVGRPLAAELRRTKEEADYQASVRQAVIGSMNEGLFVIDDAAQGFGATYHNRRLGTFGQVTCTSFFPAKPLGCYGDGGAVLTDDDGIAEALRSLRVHGQGADKYDNVRIGLASRLDTIQAAVLSEKLKIFADEIEARQVVARRYAEGLKDVVTVPGVPAGLTSVWAQYTIRVSGGRRDALAAALRAEGIPTAIYYPIPLHRQVAYRQYPAGTAGLSVSDRLAGEVISLPMHPYLDAPTQGRIVEAVRRALN